MNDDTIGEDSMEQVAETWRVVTIDGEVHSVSCYGSRVTLMADTSVYTYTDDGPREGACKLAAQERCAVREILGPGEVSAAELRTAINTALTEIRGFAKKAHDSMVGRGQSAAFKAFAKAGVYEHAAEIVGKALKGETHE